MPTDLRLAFRALARRPGFTAAAVVTLALAIGAATVVFTLVDGILLKPLPYGDSGRVVMVWSRWGDFDKTWVSAQELGHYRRNAESFEALARYTTERITLTGIEEPRRIGGAKVTANLLEVLGVSPIIGRVPSAVETLDAGPSLVMVSSAVWRRWLGGDPEVVGRSLEVDGALRTVVGVLPDGFRLPTELGARSPAEVLVFGLAEEPGESMPRGGGSHGSYGVGRLAPGATVEQARRELAGLVANLVAADIYPEDWHFEALVVPVREEVLGSLRRALLVLLVGGLLVVLIAWANIANLQLVRSTDRRRELAVRAALGAGQGRLAGGLFVESTLIAAAGGAVGAVLAWAGVDALLALDPGGIPRLAEIALDVRALAFSLLVALGSAVAFGVFPALRAARVDPNTDLKDGGSAPSLHRSQAFLVLGEVALAVVLLVGAGLLGRTVWHLLQVDPGFRSDGVLTLRLDLSRSGDQTDAPRQLERALDAVRAVPGVESAGALRVLPLEAEMGDWGTQVEGVEPPPGQMVFNMAWQVATPGTFEVLGLPILAGRGFEPSDRAGSLPVIVVSRSMALRLWPGDSALGKRVRVLSHLGEPSPWSTVVGVVGDVRHDSLTAEIAETWYLPHGQFAGSTGSWLSEVPVVIRATGEPSALASDVRGALSAALPEAVTTELRTLDDLVAESTARVRLVALVLGLAAGLAVTLAWIGVYATASYAVRQRTREIGIRVVLGARMRKVVGLLIRRGLGPVALGVTLGLVGAAAGSRVLKSLLWQVEAGDPGTYAVIAVLVGTVALAVCYLPARRALRISPLEAIKSE